IGIAASGLPRPKRHYAIVLGLGGAVVLLCGLAFFAVRLLKMGGGGLVLGGGLLLLLISWQMWRDLRGRGRHGVKAEAGPAVQRTLVRALGQIFLADISTSLDNVLAVAGVVRDQPAWVLFAGLGLSVILTGIAAAWVARLLSRWPWIGYIGLVVVVFVAGRMVWDGAEGLGWLRL
ncbi:MAG: TerC family protein, partial [Caulobacteraceae bacterium]